MSTIKLGSGAEIVVHDPALRTATQAVLAEMSRQEVLGWTAEGDVMHSHADWRRFISRYIDDDIGPKCPNNCGYGDGCPQCPPRSDFPTDAERTLFRANMAKVAALAMSAIIATDHKAALSYKQDPVTFGGDPKPEPAKCFNCGENPITGRRLSGGEPPDMPGDDEAIARAFAIYNDGDDGVSDVDHGGIGDILIDGGYEYEHPPLPPEPPTDGVEGSGYAGYSIRHEEGACFGAGVVCPPPLPPTTRCPTTPTQAGPRLAVLD